jgi:D-alanyl-D-alanine carboxypeptidase
MSSLRLSYLPNRGQLQMEKQGRSFLARARTKNREIASLTKMMTAFISIQIARRIKLDLKKTKFKVSKNSAWVGGTTAKLRTGDVLCVWDLLHGLMMPSGNDAAICLSENFGEYLYEVSQIRIKAVNSANNKEETVNNSIPNNDKRRQARDPARYFIQEMNRYARALKLDGTVYANPHGLSNINNKSTAVDQGRLGAIALQDSYLKEIVNCQEYECEGQDGKGRK